MTGNLHDMKKTGDITKGVFAIDAVSGVADNLTETELESFDYSGYAELASCVFGKL